MWGKTIKFPSSTISVYPLWFGTFNMKRTTATLIHWVDIKGTWMTRHSQSTSKNTHRQKLQSKFMTNVSALAGVTLSSWSIDLLPSTQFDSPQQETTRVTHKINNVSSVVLCPSESWRCDSGWEAGRQWESVPLQRPWTMSLFVKKHLSWHNEQRSTLKSRDNSTRFMATEQNSSIYNLRNISSKWNLIDCIS